MNSFFGSMRKAVTLALTGLSGAAIVWTPYAHAQGIPVIDVAAIAQAIEQVRAWEAQYKQMVDSLNQQKQMIDNTTGIRNLGMVSNAITRNVLPPDIGQLLQATQSHDALNLLASRNFGALSQAMQTRSAQIQDLMRQINQTQDAKSIQELTARIQAEQVMATGEAKEADWLRSQVQLQSQAIDRAHLQKMINPGAR
ncbi:type IV secretion system protein [Limnohabitans radicicola]|uniref:P-type DNA transfer protein VirB5 n=1 Tax=Limnohabitans radicicola TaxID=2771427 RepID=A0A927IMJ4_9BURK|nr:type IV secretion system protein [Limnohabitans radicicola]MBD8051067.1 hypothetical protein [Limnohabitans radicicola]